MAGKNITQRIQLVGGDEIRLQLAGIGKAGELAFTRLQTSAAKVDLGANVNSEKFVDAAQRTKELAGRIGDLKDAANKLTSTFQPLTQAVGRFAQRLTILSAGVVAGGVGLANLARNVAKQVQGESDGLQKQTQAQIDSNNAALAAEVAQINLESTLRKLNLELTSGKITYQQYNEQVRKTRQDQAEQERTANEVAAATARVKDENDRLQKSVKDREAFTKLSDQFGGPLLSSLVQFGNQLEALRVQAVANFGPAISKLVDLLSNTLTKNGSAISRFFTEASAKIDELITKHGPELEKFFETVGAAAAKVFLGLLDAAPSVIDFFNNRIAPAISRIVGFVQLLTDGINKVFGTQLTAGGLVFIAIVAQMTGSIRLLFAVLRSFTAAWKALGLVVGAVGALLNTFFGGNAVTGAIVRLGTALATSTGLFNAFFSVLRLGIPIFTGLASAIAGLLGIGFAPALAIVAALTAALFVLVTKVDWSGFLAAAGQAITGVIGFFARLLDGAKNIGLAVIGALNAAWEGVKAGAQAAWDGIGSLITGAANGIKTAWGTVTQFFTDLWAGITKLATDAWAGIQQGATDLFNFIIASAAAPFNAITDAAKSMYDSVAGWFDSLIQKAKTFLGLQAQASGGDSGDGSTPVARARGGRIFGAGSGTSDSILARVSNGEWVIKAKAVAHYGNNFLSRLNNMQLPKFADGGLVRVAQSFVPELPAMPRFATGGAVVAGGGRPMTLHIGDQAIPGLTANASAVTQLQKYAARKSVNSAGRKPLWFKG
jgi:phage-related protein